MPVTKIGFSQTEKPAPLWYRRMSNALIMFIIPGMVGMVQGWGLTDKLANRWLMILAFVPALIKGVGILMGNGQVYSPSNEAVDNIQQSETPKP